MSLRTIACIAPLWVWLTLATPAHADPLVEQETRSALARSTHGVTGKGVAVAILDRGLDWSHPDFRNADGSTRIAYIFDMTDNSGATAAGNSYGVGTIYTRAQINAALAGTAPALATRDAVGHGTATAGNCCGNGRASNGKYVGVAPESTLIIVKFTSEGAPAHDGQAAEAPFNKIDLFPKAVDFAIDKAREIGMPLVMLANFGSSSDRTDGRDALSKKIDAVVGPGKPGVVFITGTGDDGGRNNHAGGVVQAGQTAQVQIQKGGTAALVVTLWYSGDDRFNVSMATPSGNFGPYAAPANNTFDRQTTAAFNYGQDGSIYFDNLLRRIFFVINGPPGTYTMSLNGASVLSGRFDAYLGGAYFFTNDLNRFLTYNTQERTIWSAATARNNIAPNSYVFRTHWQGLDGGNYSVTNEGTVGDLWLGSSVGPTWDGRIGVDISAPGDRTITTYAPNSYWATARGNMIVDGGGLYGMASAVSAAAPVTTGVVALMLQKNPKADAAVIKSALQRSARVDAFTGAVPNPRFGYGKLDAFAAVAATPLLPIPNAVSDCIFNWAERTFPTLFNPAPATSQVFSSYYYRYYPGTGNYVAVSSADNHIWLLGPVSNNELRDVGPVSDFQGGAGCAAVASK
jgi:minor extracellular serine protease Vpr